VGAVALLVLTVAGALVPPAAQAQAQPQQVGANNTTTPTANLTTAPQNGSAPVPGSAIPASCEDIRQNPQAQGPDYRVVRGSCSIAISDGDTLSNVLFRGQEQNVEITARGSGWTVRNLAVVNAGGTGSQVLSVQVNSPDGTGIVSNVFVDGTDSNVIFVNRKHSGRLLVRKTTILNAGEDAAYSSSPGNPGEPVKPLGEGGTVRFDQVFVKNTGQDTPGYGIRLGSDGSAITNSTIIGATVGVANLFAGGDGPAANPNRAGVTIRNVDILDSEIGIRLNPHQESKQAAMAYTTITRLQNVRVSGGGTPLSLNTVEAAGEAIVRGDIAGSADPSPPPGAPRSAVRAASGVGRGMGSIGGSVPAPGPTGGSGTGSGSGVVAVITQVGAIAALGVVGLVLAVLVIALALIGWLERGGNGGNGPGGFP
jgi:hypothetical protein